MSMIVIDNFYSNPNEVREYALSQLPFPYLCSIPGERSAGVNPILSLELKSTFEDLLGKKITQWNTFNGKDFWKGEPENMNTCFQMILETEESWVHHDDNEYAGVLYLTPNPNPDSGTGLFRHKETGISEYDPTDPSTDLNLHEDRWDLSKWELIDEVKNVYNRLVIYKGKYYHRSMIPGFGKNYLEGRLTQVFFFSTEGWKSGT